MQNNAYWRFGEGGLREKDGFQLYDFAFAMLGLVWFRSCRGKERKKRKIALCRYGYSYEMFTAMFPTIKGSRVS